MFVLTGGLEIHVHSYGIGARVGVRRTVVGVQLWIPQLELREGEQVGTHHVDSCVLDERLVKPCLGQVVGNGHLLEAQEADVLLPPGTGLGVVLIGRGTVLQARIEHILVGGVVGRPAVTDVVVEVRVARCIGKGVDGVAREAAVGLCLRRTRLPSV